MAEIVVKKPVDVRGAVLITGFRGFGMVGYMVSKHVAMALGAEKVGYILTRETPPIVLIEEDGAGFPFEIYYSAGNKAVIVVNRALPEKEHADDYARTLARWASESGIRTSVLVGGLSRDFMPSGEEHGYRWISNAYYHGPELEAPQMESGLGVMGPLALLYIYMDYYKVPSIMVLPYSMVEEVDYNAAVRGVRLVAEKIVGAKINIKDLEAMADKQKEELKKVLQLIAEQGRQQEGEDKGGMYM